MLLGHERFARIGKGFGRTARLAGVRILLPQPCTLPSHGVSASFVAKTPNGDLSFELDGVGVGDRDRLERVSGPAAAGARFRVQDAFDAELDAARGKLATVMEHDATPQGKGPGHFVRPDPPRGGEQWAEFGVGAQVH